MDKMDLTLPPELDATLNRFYADPKPDPAFAARLDVDLRRCFDELSAPKVNSQRPLMRSLRARPAFALLMVLVALSLLVGVVYAVGRLSGFIPGFGFTSGTADVYVLDQPASADVDGITLTVEKAVHDGSRFWVQVCRVGLLEEQGVAYIDSSVLLPSGEEIRYQMAGNLESNVPETQMTIEFPPLPAGTESLILRFALMASGGELLQSVDIPIVLRPIRPGELIPMLPTETPSLQSETHDGLTLVLEDVAFDSDKTILQVGLRFDAPDSGLAGDWNVVLADEAGKTYPLLDISTDMGDGNTKLYQAPALNGTEALTLSLITFPYYDDGAPVYAGVADETVYFSFDPGNNPQPGQRWVLDEMLNIAGFQFHVIGANLVSSTELLFEFERVDNLTGVMLFTSDPLLNGATGGVAGREDTFTAKMTFETIPTHPFDVQVMRIYYTAHGPWQIHWKPDAASVQASGLPTTTLFPTGAVYPTPTMAATSSLLYQVQALAQKVDAPLLQGAGWIHTITVQESRVRPGQILPPPYLVTELWVEVDPDGYVIRSLYTDRDENGNILQQSVSVGNYSVNFTTGDAGYNEYSRYLFSTDLFSQDLAQAEEKGLAIQQEETTCDDGSACLFVAVSEAVSFQNPGESQATTEVGRRVWINLESGQQVELQAFAYLADGSEQIEFTREILLVEKIDSPTQDVLDILAQVTVP